MRYLHSEGIAHRDLKQENVLLTMARTPEGRAIVVPELCDFGVALTLQNSQSATHVTYAGTRGYMAPEIALGIRTGTPLQADMWSLGVMLYTMLSGEQRAPALMCEAALTEHSIGRSDPYRADPWRVLEGQLRRGESWSRLSANAQSLVRALLSIDTTKRLTAEEARMHPWFDDVRDEEDFLLKELQAVDTWRSPISPHISERQGRKNPDHSDANVPSTRLAEEPQEQPDGAISRAQCDESGSPTNDTSEKGFVLAATAATVPVMSSAFTAQTMRYSSFDGEQAASETEDLL